MACHLVTMIYILIKLFSEDLCIVDHPGRHHSHEERKVSSEDKVEKNFVLICGPKPWEQNCHEFTFQTDDLENIDQQQKWFGI